MSFYGSQPNPNTSATSHPHSNPGTDNTWPANAIDQLGVVFQDSDPALHQMGGLRRQTPQPSSDDHTLSLGEPTLPEFTNFAGSGSEKETVLLDTSRLDFSTTPRAVKQTAANSGSVPGPARSQPQQAPAYRQPWDYAGMSISGTNVSSLPPEALDKAALEEPEPTPDISADRGRRVRKLESGSFIERLMTFNTRQQHGTKRYPLESFWKPLIEDYFSPNAVLNIDLKLNGSSKLRPIRVPVEALPRIMKTKLDAGVIEERILLEEPREFIDPTNGIIIVDVPRTIILSTYGTCVVHNHGHLRVSFLRNKKIILWEFSSQKHEVLYKEEAIKAGSIPPSPCCEFGMPRSVVRLMMIANDVNDLSKMMESKIQELLEDPGRIEVFRVLTSKMEERQNAASNASFQQKTSNGSAFRAISAVLGGDVKLEQAVQGVKQEGGAAPAVSRGAIGKQILTKPAVTQHEANVNIKNSARSAADQQLKEALSSLQPEQQASMMFSNLFDDDLQAPLAPRQKVAMQKNNAPHGKDNLKSQVAGRQINLDGSQRKRRGQSAVEAVAAAASGHGGWGIGPSGQDELSSHNIGRGDPERSLRLLDSATNATLTLGHDGGNEQRGKLSREKGAPSRLDMFIPQASKVDRMHNAVGRGGVNRTPAMSGMGAVNLGTTSGGASIKEMEEFRALQRLTSKSKRDGTEDRRHEGRAETVSENFVNAPQTLRMANGSVGNGKTGTRVDVMTGGKDRTQVASGSRRNLPRNSLTDEPLEKRQKTVPGREQV